MSDSEGPTHKDQGLLRKSKSKSFQHRLGIVACMPEHPDIAVSTNGSLGRCKHVRTASPTTPIVYPAATPVRPTDIPAAKCMKPLRIVSLSELAPSTFFNVRIQAHVGGWAHRLRNENCDNKTVNCDNTGHDDRDKGLSVEIRLAAGVYMEIGLSRFLTFIIRSDRKVPTPAIPMPDFAVP